MNVVVDTDVLLALVNPKDALHNDAVILARKLERRNVTIVLLPTTISEFAKIVASQMGLSKSQQNISALVQSDYSVTEATNDLIVSAVLIYKKQSSKKESLFDCFNMAVAVKLGIKYIFSFDKGYTKPLNQFKLATDL
jgi:predicted nucleic acid-binding protein